MCCRYLLGFNFYEKLNDILETEGIKAPGRVNSETERDVRPSDASAVICGDREGLAAAEMRWGFANPYRKGLIINARSETALEKKLFSDSIMNRRIVVPASGFYEWDPYKSRFRFTLPGDELIFLAGFYREEEGIPRYTILTTEANASMKPVHDRMPVMIPAEKISEWVSPEANPAEVMPYALTDMIMEQADR